MTFRSPFQSKLFRDSVLYKSDFSGSAGGSHGFVLYWLFFFPLYQLPPVYITLVLRMDRVFSGSSIPSFLQQAYEPVQAPRRDALASLANCDCPFRI